MDKGSYSFETLEKKYNGFSAPGVEITVGMKTLGPKIPVISLVVDITAGYEAGGCTFTIVPAYDYATSKFEEGVESLFKVGQKLSVKGGYVAKKEIFYGYIDEITFEYSDDGPPSITVAGLDAKGYLMNAGNAKYYNNQGARETVNAIISQCLAKGYAKGSTVGAIRKIEAELIKRDVDDYHFLVYLAQVLGMRFFVVAGEIVFDNVINNTSPIITLNLGKSLLSFKKRLSLDKQVGKVTVKSRDPIKDEAIEGSADSANVPGEGKTAAKTAQPFASLEEVEYNYLALTASECGDIAQARLNERAMKYVSGAGRCVGLPELIPGRYVSIAGLTSAISGSYFIWSVKHEFTSAGYYTTFEVRGAKSK